VPGDPLRGLWESIILNPCGFDDARVGAFGRWTHHYTEDSITICRRRRAIAPTVAEATAVTWGLKAGQNLTMTPAPHITSRLRRSGVQMPPSDAQASEPSALPVPQA